jgi:hypothetical protein
VSYSLPSDTHVFGDAGHTTDHNNIVDVLIGMGANHYAAKFGIVADGATDNGTALNTALQAISAAGGGNLILPVAPVNSGQQVMTSKTIIIPPNTLLDGQGIETTEIRLLPGSNCDVVQLEQYNSASQAAILGIPAGSLLNAFYSGIRNLTLHGASSQQGYGGYNHCITASTNPLTTGAGSDPDFDPYNVIENVEVRSATGEGLFASGRSGLRVNNLVTRYNNGNGATPSFDTLFSVIDAGFNGVCGIYNNHGSTSGSAAKSYNNGANAQWVSLGTYTAGTPVMSAGAMFMCKLNVSGSSTAPASDTTHWAAVTATSPQAWGWQFWWDTNASEQCWTACDAQQGIQGDYYFNGCTGITVTGTSGQTGYVATGAADQACISFDACTGCVVTHTGSQLQTYASYARLVNGAIYNTIIGGWDSSGTGDVFTSDTTAQFNNQLLAINALIEGSLFVSGAVEAATGVFSDGYVYLRNSGGPPGLTSGTVFPWNNGGLFGQTNGVGGLEGYIPANQQSVTGSVGSTAAETAFATFAIPAGDPGAGAAYEIEGQFTVTTTSPAPTLTLNLRWGGASGTLLASGTAITLPTSQTGLYRFRALVQFTDASHCIGSLRTEYVTGGSSGTAAVQLAGGTSASSVTVSGTENLVVTAAFSAADGQSLSSWYLAGRKC